MLPGMSSNENWFVSLLANIFLPILILNKLSAKLGPQLAVVLALLCPFVYGAYYLAKNKSISPVSVLGLLNVLVTGGLALSGLSGIWFAVKEAAFPALVGLFVLFSSRSRKPFMQALLLNPQVMQVQKLEDTLKQRSAEQDFHELLVVGTRWLSLSFFLSAFLNFVLAARIFQPLDPTLGEAERSTQLNEQIAHMTGWSALVIVVPSMILMTILLLYLLKRLEKITGESWQSFMKS